MEISIPAPTNFKRPVLAQMSRVFMHNREILLREALGHWVSEAEPALIIQNGVPGISHDRAIGLGMVGDDEARVFVPIDEPPMPQLSRK